MQVGATIKRAVYDVLRYSQSFGGAPVCIVKALVRWATGKRLTNRLPKLSLITLSPPLNRGILGLRMGPYVPTPRFFYSLISGDPGRAIHQILDMRNTPFFKKRFSWWT